MTKGFVDFGEKAEVLRPSLKTIFNGVVLDDALTDEDGSFTTLSASGRGLADVDVSTIDLLNYDGGHHYKSSLRPRVITVRYKISARSSERFRDIYNKLNDLLSEEEKAISFTDENAYFIGTYNAREEVTETSNVVVSSFSFICADPYKYYDEKVRQFPSDYSRVYNEGTAEASPIFELTAKQKTTFAMISNQDNEYMMIGQPADVDEQVVDTRTLLFEENGSTLGQWSTSPTEVDGGVSTGALSTDGAGITVPSANYGSGNRWHGPSMIREIDSTQDFEIDMRLQAQTNTPSATYRIEFYLYDEGMNVLGKMAVLDSSQNMQRVTGEGRVGPYISRFENYVISSRNYQYNWDYFFGMCRLRRVGNKFEFYLSRVGNNDQHHVFSLKETFRDANNEFMGKLKYVQIHIGKYGDSSSAFGPKIFSIKGYALEQANVDQTPYIAYPGDLITFDHDNDEILINGEDATSLKQFGGSYFKLRKGANDIIVLPEESFETKVKFKERSR